MILAIFFIWKGISWTDWKVFAVKTNCAVFVTFSFSPKDTLLGINFVVGTSSFVIHKIICTYDKLCLSYHSLPILANHFFHQYTPVNGPKEYGWRRSIHVSGYSIYNVFAPIRWSWPILSFLFIGQYIY